MRLDTIATIRSGLVLSRKQSREASQFSYRLLNLRSVDPDGFIDSEQTDIYYANERLAPDYLSQIGDIVIRLSAPYTAVLIDDTTEGMVISSNFVVIKADAKQLLPEYLYWLLNTSKAKHAMYESSGSNMLNAVKAKFFAEMDIPLIPIEKQHMIAVMNLLAIREARLLNKLADAKKQFYDSAIDKLNNETKRGNKYDYQK